jgi:carbamoyltransferase
MANIAFTGSHNSTFVVENEGKILLVLETERFLNYKNSGLFRYKIPDNPLLVFESIMEYIKKYTGFEYFENCICIEDSEIKVNGIRMSLNKAIKARNYIFTKHHYSHAGSAFYQSPYEESIIFSFDGGGNDGTFNIYYADRQRGVLPLKEYNIDLGCPYMLIGHYLDDITFLQLHEGHMVYPGKVMGLVSYGKVNENWLKPFEEFCIDTNLKGNYNYHEFIKRLGDQIGLVFDVKDRFKGQVAYDIAATLQRAWENVFLSIAEPVLFAEKYSHLPVCLTGGCALNILLNTRLKTEYNKRVFVGPCPNDTGISAGMILNHIKPQAPVDVTYAGLPLLDINLLPQYLNENEYHVSGVNPINIIKDVVAGKIIGLAHGQSEVGPRGLGNRSIICNPQIPDMKDILNKKVKNREWYRPFAPVVRLEDVNKYFEWEEESRWMSFAPLVKAEYRAKLPAITHVDNTARVQTVTREQNPLLYDLLTEMDRVTGIGVLLNTSFNVNGKPILTTIKDIFTILKSTQLDGSVIENVYVTKHRATREYYSPVLERIIKYNVIY